MRLAWFSLVGGTLLLALAAGGAAGQTSTQPAPTTQPNFIDLKLTDATAAQAIQGLSRALGEPLPVHPQDLLTSGELPRVTLDLRQATFWQAMKEIGRQTGLEPWSDPDEASPRFALGLGKGTFWNTPHALAGPLIVFPVEVERSVTVELGKPNHRTERSLRLSFMAFPQPGLRVLGIRSDIELLEAVDDRGRSLLPRAEAGSVAPPAAADEIAATASNGAVYWDLSAELKCPANVGKTLARLRGRTHLRIQTSSQRIEVENIAKAKNVSRNVGGVAVTIKNLKKSDGDHVLHITLKRNRAPEALWGDIKQSLGAGTITLLDQKGRLIARGIDESGDSGESTIDAQIHFVPDRPPGAVGEPFKLVWEAPVDAKNLPVEFALTDLPLPQ